MRDLLDWPTRGLGAIQSALVGLETLLVAAVDADRKGVIAEVALDQRSHVGPL
jgi:hypothetical protein